MYLRRGHQEDTYFHRYLIWYYYLILFIRSLVDLARSRSDEKAFCLLLVSVSSQLRSSTSLEPVAALSDKCGLKREKCTCYNALGHLSTTDF